MQSELTWTRACVVRVDEAARAARWHLDQVTEQRAGIAPVWNDACAHEVAQRYLNPLTDEAAQALTNVVQATRDLHSCADAVQRAQEFFATASRLGQILQRSISEAQSLLRATAQQADDAAVHVDSARQQTARAHSLLAQADAAGAA